MFCFTSVSKLVSDIQGPPFSARGVGASFGGGYDGAEKIAVENPKPKPRAEEEI